MVEAESKLHKKNTYSSTILKFKYQKKVTQNGFVNAVTSGNIPSIQKLADDIKSKSMMFDNNQGVG